MVIALADSGESGDGSLMRSMRGRVIEPADEAIAIRWSAPVPVLLTVSPFAIVWGQIDPRTASAGLAASAAGWAAVTSVGLVGLFSWRSSVRKYTVVVLFGLAVFAVPEVAVHLMPVTSRHTWYAAYPVSFATVILVVYAYVAASRLPGMGVLQPMDGEPKNAVTVRRQWTPEERAARLGVSGRVLFRPSYPIVFNALFFPFLTLVSFVLALAALAVEAWVVGAAISVICVSSGRAAVRSFRVRVIADVGGITVRNLQWTHHVAWPDVQRIVPPSDDAYGYLRIDRHRRGPVRCTALAKSVFQRKRALDHFALELATLVGPLHEQVELTRVGSTVEDS